MTSGIKCFLPTMSSSSDSDCDWRCQSFLVDRIRLVGAMATEIQTDAAKRNKDSHTDLFTITILLAAWRTRARRWRLALKSDPTTCDRWASAGLASCHQWVFFGRRSPLCWPVWWCRGNLSRPLWTPAWQVYGETDDGGGLTRLCGGDKVLRRRRRVQTQRRQRAE